MLIDNTFAPTGRKLTPAFLTQGAASLALGYVMSGLSGRASDKVGRGPRNRQSRAWPAQSAKSSSARASDKVERDPLWLNPKLD